MIRPPATRPSAARRRTSIHLRPALASRRPGPTWLNTTDTRIRYGQTCDGTHLLDTALFSGQPSWHSCVSNTISVNNETRLSALSPGICRRSPLFGQFWHGPSRFLVIFRLQVPSRRPPGPRPPSPVLRSPADGCQSADLTSRVLTAVILSDTSLSERTSESHAGRRKAGRRRPRCNPGPRSSPPPTR
jgi:hypothetical protein